MTARWVTASYFVADDFIPTLLTSRYDFQEPFNFRLRIFFGRTFPRHPCTQFLDRENNTSSLLIRSRTISINFSCLTGVMICRRIYCVKANLFIIKVAPAWSLKFPSQDHLEILKSWIWCQVVDKCQFALEQSRCVLALPPTPTIFLIWFFNSCRLNSS